MYIYTAYDSTTGEAYKVSILQSCDNESPLSYTDPETEHRPLFVLTNHNRYDLGDKDALALAWQWLQAEPSFDPDWLDPDSPDYIDDEDDNELNRLITACNQMHEAQYLPVYLYDHGGLALSSTPFSCKWDSGWLGIVLWTRTECEAYHAPGSHAGRDVNKEVMESYLKELAQYVEGDVWDIIIENANGDILDCGGTQYVEVYGLDYAKASLETEFNLSGLRAA
jgi:hypothetical protein